MCAQLQQDDGRNQLNTGTGMSGSGALRLTANDLDFSPEGSTKVISSAQKFILPIAALVDGEPLVYPQGDPNAGKPIVDWKGNSVGDMGIVFFNRKDNCWQAAPGDGTAVIIMNEVTEEQARVLLEKINLLSDSQGALSRNELKQLLEFGLNTLGIGDSYTSTRSFISENMTPVTDELLLTSPSGTCGLMKRDARDIWQAVYVPDEFTFEGPAATPQVFKNGGVLVKKGDSIHGIDPEVFVRTYRLSDGTAITDLSSDIRIG